MSSATTATPPVGPPLKQAVRALAKLDTSQAAAAIRSRITNGPEKFGLPALQPQEDRVDIFVQVYEYGDNGEVKRRLPAACVSLLNGERVDTGSRFFNRSSGRSERHRSANCAGSERGSGELLERSRLRLSCGYRIGGTLARRSREIARDSCRPDRRRAARCQLDRRGISADRDSGSSVAESS